MNRGSESNVGAAYVFTYSDTIGWREVTTLVSTEIENDALFGYYVAIDGDVVS